MIIKRNPHLRGTSALATVLVTKLVYDWAAKKDIRHSGDCGGKSRSFIEGCKAYAADQ